jgi:hypothetical protein
MNDESLTRDEQVELFRETRTHATEYFPAYLCEALTGLSKKVRVELTAVIDAVLMQIVEWDGTNSIAVKEGDYAVEDMITSFQLLANLLDDESNYDGSDPGYEDGWPISHIAGWKE